MADGLKIRMTPLSLFNRNLILLTMLSLLWAWQVLLASAFILSHFSPSSGLASQVLPEWRYLLKPEWKPFIYHLVLIAGIAFQSILLWLNRRELDAGDLLKRWQTYLIIEILSTFLWSSAAFKIIVYSNRPDLAKGAFIILFIFAILCKVFCDRWQNWTSILWNSCLFVKKDLYWRRVAEWCVPVGLCILLYIPNIQGVVARNFIGEQFHHNDSFIMGPGWAYLSGQVLDVDIISEYGIGFVVVISRLAQLFGGFTYEHVMGVMVIGTLLYYLAWYFLIRRWLGSLLLVSAVMLTAIKLQLFHFGVYPFVFTYGSATPMRFIYDAVYFWCLWMHINTGRKSWLWGAGTACGFGIYYLTSEGLYATASFDAYILLLWFLPVWREHFRIRLRDGLLILLPLVVAIFFLTLTIGSNIVTAPFWNNIGEFISYFTSGFGLEPMYKTLLDHKYLESLLGFVLPMGYLLTLMILISRLAFNLSPKEEWLAVVLCFYGLGTYHYYIERSTGTSYYAVILPLVFVAGFWLKMAIDSLRENRRTPLRLVLAALAAWALFTNHLFLAYPNILNISSHPLTDPKVALPLPADGEPYFNHLFRNFNPDLKLSINSLGGTQEELPAESDFADDNDLVDYYRKNSRFTQDTQLIDSLTAHSDEIPLISSFETEILMQANRKTFFYYFPLIISRPMTMRSFEVCSIYTTDQLAKTIDKFERVKPPYVFMERIYMVNEVPKAFLFEYPSLIPLINYVRTHYALAAQGEYLVALKRTQ
jgi:hypothetical protein